MRRRRSRLTSERKKNNDGRTATSRRRQQRWRRRRASVGGCCGGGNRRLTRALEHEVRPFWFVGLSGRWLGRSLGRPVGRVAGSVARSLGRSVGSAGTLAQAAPAAVGGRLGSLRLAPALAAVATPEPPAARLDGHRRVHWFGSTSSFRRRPIRVRQVVSHPSRVSGSPPTPRRFL